MCFTYTKVGGGVFFTEVHFEDAVLQRCILYRGAFCIERCIFHCFVILYTGEFFREVNGVIFFRDMRFEGAVLYRGAF